MDIGDIKTPIEQTGIHPDIIKQSIYKKYPKAILEQIKIELVEMEYKKRENIKDISKTWKKELTK